MSAEAKCVVEKFGYTFIIEQGRIVKIKGPSDLQFLRLGRPWPFAQLKSLVIPFGIHEEDIKRLENNLAVGPLITAY